MIAVENGFTGITHLLIEYGADINERGEVNYYYLLLIVSVSDFCLVSFRTNLRSIYLPVINEYIIYTAWSHTADEGGYIW